MTTTSAVAPAPATSSRRRFEGKIAVVTGGNSGIGLAAAQAYASEGAHVAISGRDEQTIQSAVQVLGENAWGSRTDVSRPAELQSFFDQIKKRFGKIDALFVNAGIGKFVPFEQVTEAFYDETMNTNLKGVFFTVQKALPLMSRGSAIVLNASINGHMGMAKTTVYGASKAAVINLAKTLSADLLEKGIRVNAVSPGPIRTPIFDRMEMPAEEKKKTQDWIQSQVPLKRFGTPEEIASAVLYLSAPESSFVVGSELIVDGGFLELV